MTLRADVIAMEIDNLLLQYPELAGDEQLRADMLEGATSLHDFLQGLVKKIGDTQAYSAGCKLYIKSLQGRTKMLDQRIDMMRGLIQRMMEKADLTRVQLDVANLQIMPSGRSVVITDEKQLPEDCLRKWTEPNKVEIKNRLVAGTIVPGAVLSNSTPHLTIRTK
jgi:hypothetical protein